MKKLRKFSCKLCKGEKFTIICSPVIMGIGKFDLVQCKKCAFCFISPNPAKNQLKSFYSSAYFKDSQYGYGDYLKKNTLTSRQKGKKLASQLNKVPKKGNFLEIGCATGHFLYEIKKASGWRTFGIELSHWAAEYAKKNFGLEILEGDFDEIKLPRDFFDFIYIEDVLEHVSDPLKFMKKVNTVLRKNGLILLRLPCSAFELKAIKRDKRIQHPHLTFFTENNIKALLYKTGFKIKKLEYAELRGALRDVGILPSFRELENIKGIKNIIGFKRNLNRSASAAEKFFFHTNLKRPLIYSLTTPLKFGHEFEIIAQKK